MLQKVEEVRGMSLDNAVAKVFRAMLSPQQFENLRFALSKGAPTEVEVYLPNGERQWIRAPWAPPPTAIIIPFPKLFR
jgi:hypothetical protein